MIHINSWISTFIAPIALALLVWRTVVEDRRLQRNLPGYAHYAARVPYRLAPGLVTLRYAEPSVSWNGAPPCIYSEAAHD